MSDNLVDKVVLKGFVPPSALNAENFQELAGKTVVETIPAGKTVFKPGDTDRKTVYLIEGEIELTPETGEKSLLKFGTDLSKHYILYCDTGRRSLAGAFLLNERGLHASCLQGGLKGRST